MPKKFGDRRRKSPQEKRGEYLGVFTDIDTAVWVENESVRRGQKQSEFVHYQLKKLKKQEESESV